MEGSPRNKVRFQKVYEWPMFVHKNGEIGVIVVCLCIYDTLCVGNKNAIKGDIKTFFVTKEEGEETEYVGCMIKKKTRCNLSTSNRS